MLTRLRVLSPLGFYPARDIVTNSGRFIIEDDIAFLMTSADLGRGVSGPESVSEIEFLTLEEIRLLGCITISWKEEHGSLSFYPIPHHIDLVLGPTSQRDELLGVARRHVVSIQENYRSEGLTLPLADVHSYSRQDREADDKLVDQLCDKVASSHHLMLRGLSALVRAGMLWRRREFQEQAIATLHVALAASQELIFDILRKEGNPGPSSKEASARLALAFGDNPRGDAYFADYYEDRIVVVHPRSRHGTFAFPPLAADDFYDLRTDLVAVFFWLLTGQVPERVLVC